MVTPAEPETMAEALQRVLDEKKVDGTPKFGPLEVRGVQAIIYLELARRGDPTVFTHEQKVELAGLLDEIGVDENTDPAAVAGLVKDYFVKLKANPAIFIKLDRLLKRFKKIEDRLEAADQSSLAFQKMTEQEGPKAPGLDEKAPEGSKAAQSLAQSLGVKVRI